MNSFTSPCICSILRRMLRMISTPARLTPRSRVSVRIVSSCSRSSSEYRRVLPSVRDGLSNPSRSYRRSVCGWMLYFCDTALIMWYALPLARFAILELVLFSLGLWVPVPRFAEPLSHVFSVDPSEFAQQFLRSLVEDLR